MNKMYLNMLVVLKYIDKLIGVINNMLSLFKPSNPKKINNNIRSICIIKLSAMGDVICLASAVQQYKDLYPDVVFTLLTTKRSNPKFIEKIKCFDNIYTIRMNFNILSDIIKFRSSLNFDLVIDCDQYYNISEFISFLYKNTIGFSSQTKGKLFSFTADYDHNGLEKQNFLSLLKLAEEKFYGKVCLKNSFNNIIYSSTSTKTNILNELDGIIIVVYPGSSSNAMFRRWSTEKFVQLANCLKKDFNVVIAGGLDEVDLIPFFKSYFSDKYLLINKLKLSEWVDFFLNSKAVFIGNDAGLTHVADSCGVPCVSFFGPTTPNKWGATSKGSVIIYKQLNCSPCIKTGLGIVPTKCRYDHVNCLKQISVDDALNAVNQALTSL